MDMQDIWTSVGGLDLWRNPVEGLQEVRGLTEVSVLEIISISFSTRLVNRVLDLSLKPVGEAVTIRGT